MARAFPVGKGSKEVTFTALAADSGHDKVRGLLIKGHMEKLGTSSTTSLTMKRLMLLWQWMSGQH
jgi:hypothetical protein